jgi:hypothetical protein
LIYVPATATCADPPRITAPGDTVAATLTVPPLAPGRYRLELDCVASRVAWFAQVGSKPVTVQLEIDQKPST